MSSIEKPIVIGKTINNQVEIGWGWWHEHFARLAIIGDEQKSPRENIVKSIARLINERNPDSVFWITGDSKSSLSKVFSIQSIPWVEQFPDPPKEFGFDDRDIFINNRKFFSSSFFTLLANIKGIPRQQMIPPTSYRGHVEGPMAGYVRSIESIDKELKGWLMQQIMDLENVYWYETKNGGKKFHLSDDGPYEKALSFLIAAWSFWTFTCELEEPRQMLLIMEPPKEFLMPNADPVIQEIIVEAMRILNNLSITTTTSILLSSETFNPVPFHNYRFRIIFQTEDSDIDLTTPENKLTIQLPEMYTAWEHGNYNVGLWEDNYSGERFPVNFEVESICFWDDFDLNENQEV